MSDSTGGAPPGPASPSGPSYPELTFHPPPTLGGMPMHEDHVLGNASAGAAHFGKIKEVSDLHQRFASALGELSEMGLSVSPEDVIKKAGDLVGKGADPMNLAGVLADMPSSGGEALASWVGQHVVEMNKLAKQSKDAFEQSRHAMGVGALQALIHHSMPQALDPGAPGSVPGPMPGAPNPLMPGAPQ